MAFVDASTYAPEVGTQQPQQQSAAPIAAGGAGVAAGATKAAATPGVNIPQQPSSQLKDYIAANAPQTQQYAGQISGQLGQQVQQAGAAIQPAVNTYTGQLYTVPTNAQVNQEVATSPSSLSAQDKATYQQELNASANVPNSANTFEASQPYANVVSNIQNAVNQANLWNAGNNVPSLTAAVQPYENPNSTQGVTTLDALLLSQTPGAYNQIQSAVAPAANLQSQLTAGTTQADTALQNAIAQDQAATTAATGAANTYAQNLTNYLNQAVANATASGQQLSTAVNADIANGNLTAADAAGLGLTQDQAIALNQDIQQANGAMARANTGTLNLSQYLKSVAPTAQNLATQQNYADVAALQGLLGTNAPVLPISSTTASEASSGTPLSLNYADAVQAAQIQNQVAPLQAQAQGIQNQINNAEQQYSANHFGGQTPGQFNSYINQLSSQLTALNNQIAALNTQIPAGVS